MRVNLLTLEIMDERTEFSKTMVRRIVVFIAEHKEEQIKAQICSVLAGYVWDMENPYVSDHSNSLKRLARLVDVEGKLKEQNA